MNTLKLSLFIKIRFYKFIILKNSLYSHISFKSLRLLLKPSFQKLLILRVFESNRKMESNLTLHYLCQMTV